MDISYSNYVENTLPEYIDKMVNEIPQKLKNIDKQSQLYCCMDYINEIKEFSQGICSKLKSQTQFYRFAISIQKFIMQVKEIGEAEKYNKLEQYFSSWIITRFSKIDQYVLQFFLRLICIGTQYESKKYFEHAEFNYKNEYENDLTKIYFTIQTLSITEKYQIDIDEIFYQMSLRMITKSSLFIKYMLKWCKENELGKCAEYFKTKQSSLKKRMQKEILEKKKSFQQFRIEKSQQESSLMFNEDPQNSQVFNQSEPYNNTANNTTSKQVNFHTVISRDKRLSQMIQGHLQNEQNENHFILQRKSNDKTQSLELQNFQKSKENQKLNSQAEVQRPSLNRRTINGGINAKYKIDNDKKKNIITKQSNSGKKKQQQQRPPQSMEQIEQVKQMNFCLEVSEKLKQLKESKNRKIVSYNSQYLANETPSNENSSFL